MVSGGDQDDVVIMPIKAVQRRFTGNRDIRLMLVGVDQAYSTSTVQAGITDLLRERHLIEGVPWSQMAVLVRSGALVPAIVRALAAAEMDMSWHSLTAAQGLQNADAFEQKALAATGLDVADVPPRYRSAYFHHIFGGGYSAGYYSYLWSEVMDADTVAWFRRTATLSA